MRRRGLRAAVSGCSGGLVLQGKTPDQRFGVFISATPQVAVSVGIAPAASGGSSSIGLCFNAMPTHAS